MEERSGPHYTDNYIPVHQEPTSHKGMNLNPNPAFLKFFDPEKKSRFEAGFKFAHHYVDERVSERNMSMVEADDRVKVPSIVKSEQPYLEKSEMEQQQQMHFHRSEHSPNQEWMAKYYNKEPANMHPFQMDCASPQPPPPPPPPPPPAPPREENCAGEGSPKLEIDYLEDSLNPQLPDFIPQGMNHKDESLADEDPIGVEKKSPPDEKKAVLVKPFLCSKCEYKTNFKSNLKSHELNHSGTYKFQCSKCEYKTNFKSNLKNHELNHSLTYKFQCADCEYKTNFKSNLKNHELSHSMTYRFQCEKCEYKTNFKNCMKNHELTHSGTKQFHCAQCEYKTNFKRCLKIHELRHANT